VVYGVYGFTDQAELVEAAAAAGATPTGQTLSGVEAAVRALGPLAAPEVAAVCGIPVPAAVAELGRLMLLWCLSPERLGSGELWSASPG